MGTPTSWVEPWNTLPADTEEDVVQEKERNRGRSDFVLVSIAIHLVVTQEDCDQ